MKKKALFGTLLLAVAVLGDGTNSYGTTEAAAVVDVLSAIKTFILPLVGAVVSFFIVMKWLKRGSGAAVDDENARNEALMGNWDETDDGNWA